MVFDVGECKYYYTQTITLHKVPYFALVGGCTLMPIYHEQSDAHTGQHQQQGVAQC